MDKKDKAHKKKQMLMGYCALIFALILLFVLTNYFVGYITSETHIGEWLELEDGLWVFEGNIIIGADWWQFFCYFTFQINFVVLAWLIIWGVTRFKGRETKLGKLADNRTLITTITVYTTFMFLASAFILEPIWMSGYWENPITNNDFFLHYATPVVMWLYFFLVQGRGRTKYKSILYILIYPFIYGALNEIIGATVKFYDGSPAYNYSQLNPNNYPNVFVYGLILVAIFTLIAVLAFSFITLKQFIVKNYHEDDTKK